MEADDAEGAFPLLTPPDDVTLRVTFPSSTVRTLQDDQTGKKMNVNI